MFTPWVAAPLHGQESTPQPQADGPTACSLIEHKGVKQQRKTKGYEKLLQITLCTAVKNLSRTTGWEDTANLKFFNFIFIYLKSKQEGVRS